MCGEGERRVAIALAEFVEFFGGRMVMFERAVGLETINTVGDAGAERTHRIDHLIAIDGEVVSVDPMTLCDMSQQPLGDGASGAPSPRRGGSLLEAVHHAPDIVEGVLVRRSLAPLVAGHLGLEVAVVDLGGERFVEGRARIECLVVDHGRGDAPLGRVGQAAGRWLVARGGDDGIDVDGGAGAVQQKHIAEQDRFRRRHRRALHRKINMQKFYEVASRLSNRRGHIYARLLDGE